MTELLAVIVGAVVGGIASLAGTIWVQRREVVRSARLHMYVDLLRELQASIQESTNYISIARLAESKGQLEFRGRPVPEVLDELCRYAVIAGHTEADLADEALKAWRSYASRASEKQTLNRETGQLEPKIDRTAEKARFDTAVEQLDALLTRRLDHRL